MKKLMLLVMALMLCLGTAAADMLPADTVTFNGFEFFWQIERHE